MILKETRRVVDENGTIYPSRQYLSRKLNVCKDNISRALKKHGVYTDRNGLKYYYLDEASVPQCSKPTVIYAKREDEKEYEEFKKHKEIIKEVEELPFTQFNFKYAHRTKGTRYAIALFSDAHIEEIVKPESVLGKNEYNVKIAEERIAKYFNNLADCLNTDEVDDLIFASLGDTISGFIHEELAQCNELTPLKAISKAQSLIVSGLQFLCSNTKLNSIKFIGIVGNHSRTTKKIQHSNGYEMSYEWLMYENIKNNCESLNLPIEFAIPESEVALVSTPDNKTLLFCHGFQIKSTGTNTVCGIYPSLQRLALKWGRTYNQDRIYLGHFHSCISIPTAAVNGSIIGYNTYALTNGFEYQKPCQYYEVIDTSFGQLLERKIYCE